MARGKDRYIAKALWFCAFITVLTTIGIVLTLSVETFSFFKEVAVSSFLTGTKWTPLFVPKHFGILPLLAGTMMITIGASFVAIPLGLGSAIYLSEYAPEWLRKILKPILEILAGIPTIVYGYFALTLITPLVRMLLPETDVFNALSASIAVGIMIIPMISSLSEDALRAVPDSIREAAFALGSTRLEVALRVVVPAAFSGIMASFVLAISRAIGETMIVTVAAGATPKLTINPLESIQTMTSYIVQVSLGDTPHGSIEYKTIFAVGMMLFIITLLMNLLAQYIKKRWREEY